MSKKLNLTKDQGKNYVQGSKSEKSRAKIVNAFNNEVVKQILLGNKVLLPGDMTIEIIKHEYTAHPLAIKKLPRFGFNYKVRFTYDKLKVKKIKFTPAKSLEKKLRLVLENTDFEYKLVDNSFR